MVANQCQLQIMTVNVYIGDKNALHHIIEWKFYECFNLLKNHRGKFTFVEQAV